MGKVEGITLVERDQLEAAAKELSLDTMAGANSAQARLKLGKLLHADLLLLLNEESISGHNFIKVVVADCRTGVRLPSSATPVNTPSV